MAPIGCVGAHVIECANDGDGRGAGDGDAVSQDARPTSWRRRRGGLGAASYGSEHQEQAYCRDGVS